MPNLNTSRTLPRGGWLVACVIQLPVIVFIAGHSRASALIFSGVWPRFMPSTWLLTGIILALFHVVLGLILRADRYYFAYTALLPFLHGIGGMLGDWSAARAGGWGGWALVSLVFVIIASAQPLPPETELNALHKE